MVRFAKKYWLVFRVALVLLKIRLALRLLSLPRVLTSLSPVGVTKVSNEGAMDDLVYYIDRWLEILPYNRKGNCFPRSLTLYWFARRSGYPVRFHCGIRKEASKLDGHAGLTLEGRPFHETVTFSYPSDLAVDRAQGETTHSQGSRIMLS
jgi:hypothetical protein